MRNLTAANVSVRRVGRHPVLLPVAGHELAVDGALDVLAAHRELVDLLHGDGPIALQHLDLLVAHRVGAEGDRRLHGDQREELQEVVLDHVAQRAGLFVVGAPVLDARASRRR